MCASLHLEIFTQKIFSNCLSKTKLKLLFPLILWYLEKNDNKSTLNIWSLIRAFVSSLPLIEPRQQSRKRQDWNFWALLRLCGWWRLKLHWGSWNLFRLKCLLKIIITWWWTCFKVRDSNATEQKPGAGVKRQRLGRRKSSPLISMQDDNLLIMPDSSAHAHGSINQNDEKFAKSLDV